MNQTNARKSNLNLRIRLGLAIVIFGLLVFALGVQPAFFGLDRSPVVGFVQIAVFLIGLGVICVGGYLVLNTLWNGRQKTIAADIGYRLVATGYVVAAISGLADVFGFGSQPFPYVPYFGLWQALGVMVGQVSITIGFALLIPPSPRKNSPTPE